MSFQVFCQLLSFNESEIAFPPFSKDKFSPSCLTVLKTHQGFSGSAAKLVAHLEVSDWMAVLVLRVNFIMWLRLGRSFRPA